MAALIVPVIKSDGNVRICGDYKVTKRDVYPLPKDEDLFAALAGGKLFSNIDLDDASKEYTTINTHKGPFQYERLPFGISSEISCKDYPVLVFTKMTFSYW